MSNSAENLHQIGISKDIVSLNPPEFWESHCQKHNSLFNTTAWQSVLCKGFSTHTLYLWQAESQTAAAVPIFRIGPFRIGYLGFPVGNEINNESVISGFIRSLADFRASSPPHIIRWSNSAFKTAITLPYRHQTLPETSVINLQTWSDHMLPNSVLRNLKKSARHQLTVMEADQATQHGKCMHDLYRQTIKRHGGQVRYTEAYFCALVQLAASSSQLHCFLATLRDKIAGFLVLAFEGDVAYYLHGATNIEFASLRPADLLFHHAISKAKEFGFSSFNMLGSPKNQPSLVRFKEKWGGTTRPQANYEIPIKPSAAKIFHTAYTCYKFLRRT